MARGRTRYLIDTNIWSALIRRSELEQAGTPIGPNDTWIAAEAVYHQLVLVTDNTREFARVSGLLLENWIKSHVD